MKKILLAILLTLFTASILPTTSSAATDTNYANAAGAGKKLLQKTNAFNQTIGNGDLYYIDEQYDAFSAEIKKVERAIGKVSGSKNRKYLNDTYVKVAKVARERVIYEVSQYRLIAVITDSYYNSEFTKMKNDYAKLDRLKKRAVAIKQAGGYKALPASVNQELSAYINWFSDKLTQTTAGDGEAVKLTYNPATGDIQLNGATLSQSRNETLATLGQPTYKELDEFLGETSLAYVYPYPYSEYDEDLYVSYDGNDKVYFISHTYIAGGYGFPAEFLDAFDGDVYYNPYPTDDALDEIIFVSPTGQILNAQFYEDYTYGEGNFYALYRLMNIDGNFDPSLYEPIDPSALY